MFYSCDISRVRSKEPFSSSVPSIPNPFPELCSPSKSPVLTGSLPPSSSDKHVSFNLTSLVWILFTRFHFHSRCKFTCKYEEVDVATFQCVYLLVQEIYILFLFGKCSHKSTELKGVKKTPTRTTETESPVRVLFKQTSVLVVLIPSHLPPHSGSDGWRLTRRFCKCVSTCQKSCSSRTWSDLTAEMCFSFYTASFSDKHCQSKHVCYHRCVTWARSTPGVSVYSRPLKLLMLTL